ncbi:glycosyltransferase [Sulfurovum sp.]|uniref:CgeB family protein n=1 Tax=Sulfurovum sp. TaxID=1969726 RepID=UPI0035684887
MKRIALLGDIPIDSLNWHIHYTLQKMGYDVKNIPLTTQIDKKVFPASLFGYALKLSNKFNDFVYTRLLNNVLAFEPELIIVVLRNIPSHVINTIKKKSNAKVVFWSGDAMVNLQRGDVFISDFDAWFVKDKYMYSFMKDKANLKVFLLPECMNPDVHKLPENMTFGGEYDISIVGSLYPYRARIIEQINSAGFDVDIFGNIPKWMGIEWQKKHSQRYVTMQAKSKVFYGSKINLNTLHYSEVSAGNCRLFEIAGCGGFQICDEKNIIRDYFEEDKEIVFYRTTAELIEKIAYYLNHQDEAKVIAQNAHKRAHLEHTYEHRIKEIFQIIDFPLIKI